MTQISIIVPLYNRMDIFPRALASIFNQDLDPSEYEVIVVDDCSSDHAREYVNSISDKYTNLVYVYHTKNLGLSAARNSGIKLVSSDLMLFLDADMVIPRNFLNCHINAHRSHVGEKVAIISNVVYPQHYIGSSNFAKFIQSRELGSRPLFDRLDLDYNNLPSRCFAGGASSVALNVIKEVGLFNEAFRTYGGEDEEFGWRLQKAGSRIMLCRDAISYHHDTLSLDRFKMKLIETCSGNYRKIIKENIEQFSGGRILMLLPVNWSEDTLYIIFTKLALRCVLNSSVTSALEYILRRTDSYSLFYSKTICRLVCAGWMSAALRCPKPNSPSVW